MCSIQNNETWREFFSLFQQLPELWQVKNDIFKNKQKKILAWEKLLKKYLEIDPESNVEALKQRVRNIRSVYRREIKKVEKSEKSGASADDIYVPSIWYFDQLHFLRDQEITVPTVSSMDIEPQDETIVIGAETPLHSTKKRRTIEERMEERNSILKDAVQRLTSETKDEAAVYADAWAASYRKLKPMQQIYAKQAIDHILVMGQLDKLTFNFAASLPTPNFETEPMQDLNASTSSNVVCVEEVPHVQYVAVEGSYDTIADLLQDSTYNDI